MFGSYFEFLHMSSWTADNIITAVDTIPLDLSHHGRHTKLLERKEIETFLTTMRTMIIHCEQ